MSTSNFHLSTCRHFDRTIETALSRVVAQEATSCLRRRRRLSCRRNWKTTFAVDRRNRRYSRKRHSTMMTIVVFLVEFFHKMYNKRVFRRRNLIDKVSSNFGRQSKCRQSTICRRIRRRCRNESLRLSLGQMSF